MGRLGVLRTSALRSGFPGLRTGSVPVKARLSKAAGRRLLCALRDYSSEMSRQARAQEKNERVYIHLRPCCTCPNSALPTFVARETQLAKVTSAGCF